MSTNVTKLNFFCFEVEISVERKSITPAQIEYIETVSGKDQCLNLQLVAWLCPNVALH